MSKTKYVVALSNGEKQKIVNRRYTIRDYNFVSFQIDNLDKYDGEEPRVRIHYYGKKPDGYPNGGFLNVGAERCYVSKTFQLIGAIDAKVISILFSAFPKERLPILKDKFKINYLDGRCVWIKK